MDIKTYLKKSGRTQREFAASLGVTQSVISQWIKGICRISAESAIKIEQETDGQVNRRDLRPDLYSVPEKVAS